MTMPELAVRDEVEPGRALEQRNEVEAGMPSIPQHRVMTAVDRQSIDDEIRLPCCVEDFQPIEEGDPGRCVACGDGGRRRSS